MGYFADIYIIQESRSQKLGIDFLNNFLPLREISCDEFLIPVYSENPIKIFDNANDLMSYLESNKEFAQSIYWRNTEEKNPNKHGMIFYTEDGNMIFGISRIANGISKKNETECLMEMKSYFNTEFGYIDYENPPVDTYLEFVEKVKISKE